MSELADAIAASARAAPHLDPNMHVGIAQANGGDVAGTVRDASAVAGFSQGAKYMEALQQQPPDVQRQIFASLQPAQQSMVASQGYVVPAPKEEGGSSLFDDIIETGSKILGKPFELLNDVTGGLSNEVLHEAGAPLRAVQHGIRAGLLLSQRADMPGGGLGTMSNPDQWADAWNDSEHGERTFNPRMEQYIRGKYGGDVSDVAKRIASGDSLESVVANLPQDEKVRIAQLADTEEVQAAATEFERAKISLGRAIAGDVLHITDPDLHKLISGAIDATADIRVDPLIVGGKATKAYRAEKFAIRGADDVRRLADTNPAVQAHLADVSSYVSDGRIGELIERYPKLAPVADELVQAGATTPEKLTEWYASQAGMTAIMEGRVGGMVAHQPVMPNLTSAGRARLWVKGAMTEVIDFAADHPFKVNPEAARVVAEGQYVTQAAAGVVPTAIEEARTAMRAEASAAEVAGRSAEDAVSGGRPANLPATGGIIPATGEFVPPTGEAAAATPGGRSGRYFVLTGMAKTARKFSTLIPEGAKFDPMSPAALTVVDRLARQALPATEARRLVDLWAATPDLSRRFGIYKGLLAEVGAAAGAGEWMGGFLNRLEEGHAGRTYAAGGIDNMLVAGKKVASALLPEDMTSEWSVPAFRELWANSRRTGLSKVVWGGLNSEAVNHFMDTLWRPLTLLRLGFPARAGSEELVGQALREGPIGALRARVGLSAALREARREAGDAGIVARAVDNLTSHMPDSVRDRFAGGAEVDAEVMADRATRSMADVAGRYSREEYRAAAKEMVGTGYFDGPIHEQISAAHGAGGYLMRPDEIARYAWDGHKLVPARLIPTGEFRQYHAAEDLFAHQWKTQLDKLHASALGNRALELVSTERVSAVKKLADFIETGGMDEARDLSLRAKQLRDGRVVGLNATARDAAEDWASATLDHANSLLHSPDGTRILDPALLLDKGIPPLQDLAEIDMSARPAAVAGEDMLPVAGRGWYRNLLDKGFRQIVGRPMNWIARDPMFLHNYVAASKEIGGSLAGVVDDAAKAEITVERALAKTIPYIHNPRLRSQMAEVMRNLVPFWFAQEQFFKRWARTFTHSPEAFREAQLTVNGLRAVGFLHKDEQGNDVFTYPLVGALQRDVVATGFKLFTGRDVNLPVPVGFSGELRFATPGLERIGLPSFGPLVSIPVNWAASQFPELQRNASALLGERGAGRGIWEQILPTTLSRAGRALFAGVDTDAGMHSAALQAMQYLAAHGNTPPETANADEIQKYQDRVKNLARTIMITRTLYGFGAPAAPSVDLDPEQMQPEFMDLVKALGIHDGTAEFIRRYPDSTPYTVFQTKNLSGAYIPPVQETMDFLETNKDFLAAYPRAGGWFVADTPADKSYNPAVYREQLALGMRQKKSLEDFTRELYYRSASAEYYDQKKLKDADLKATRSPGERSAINGSWKDWSDAYKAAHPIFADYLVASKGPQDRAEALTELHRALVDPRAPANPQMSHLAELVAAHDDLREQLSGLSVRHTKRNQRIGDGLKSQFVAWANQYVTDNPDVRGAYDRLMRPDLEG